MRFLSDSVSCRRRRAAGAMRPVVLLAVAVSGALPLQAQPGLPPSMAGSNQVSMIGVFRGAAGQLAAWFVDSNGDYQYETSDQVMSFGLGGDLPIVGDWNNNGQLNIGVFRDGTSTCTPAPTATATAASGAANTAATRKSKASITMSTNSGGQATSRWPGTGTTPGTCA